MTVEWEILPIYISTSAIHLRTTEDLDLQLLLIADLINIGNTISLYVIFSRSGLWLLDEICTRNQYRDEIGQGAMRTQSCDVSELESTGSLLSQVA